MKKIISLLTVFVIAITSTFVLTASAYDLNNTPYTETEWVNKVLDELGSTPNNYIVVLGCNYSSGDVYNYYISLIYTNNDELDPVSIITDEDCNFEFEFGSSAWMCRTHRYQGKYSFSSCDRETGNVPNGRLEGFTDGYRILYSTVPIYDENGKNINPTSKPRPFDVIYSPDLYVGMPLEYEYPSKSGGIIKDSFKELTVSIRYNPDFILWAAKEQFCLYYETDRIISDSDFLATLPTVDVPIDLSYLFEGKKGMFFISGLSPSSRVSGVLDNAIYTYLSKQKYSIIDINNGYVDGFTSTATYANGLYPLFSLDFDTEKYDISNFEHITYADLNKLLENPPAYKITFDLSNVSWSDDYPTYFPYLFLGDDLEYNDELYTTDKNFSDYFNDVWNSRFSPKTIWTKNGEVDIMRYWYCDTEFSFDKYPDFVPFEYNGKIYSTKGNPFNFMGENAYPPDSYQSVNDDGTLSEERTPDEQQKYDDEIRWSNEFMTDFSVGDIKSIFDGTSSFYQFLTASISILPSWFMTILASFFVVMLAIVVVKMVI